MKKLGIRFSNRQNRDLCILLLKYFSTKNYLKVFGGRQNASKGVFDFQEINKNLGNSAKISEILDKKE